MNQQSHQAPVIPVHACFSGDLACSGCNPCPACKQVRDDMVIAPALAESVNRTVHELASFVYELVQAMQARGIDPRQLGLQLPASLPDAKQSAALFWQANGQAWQNLYARMQQGDLVGRYVTQPVARPPAVAAPVMHGHVPGMPEIQPPRPYDPFETPPAVPVAPGSSPSVSRTATTAAPPHERPSPAVSRVQVAMPKGPPPIEAGELAAMVGAPVPLSHVAPPNGTGLNGAGE